MHEYPITQEIINIASKYALKDGCKKVCRISLVMGENCGYLADSIAMYFDIIAEGSPCDGAKLEFENIEAKLECKSCGKLFRRRPFEFSCPVPGCDGEGMPTEIGREFYIKSIEIEA